MVDYKVTVTTGYLKYAGTLNDVYIKLVGTVDESERTWLKSPKGAFSFMRGKVASLTVSCSVSIGKLIRIELDKQPVPLFPEDTWFPDKVEVKSPEGDTDNFPIYRWINDSEVHRFRKATALRAFEDKHPKARNKELEQRKEDYRWDVYLEGIPHCMRSEDPSDLPDEVQFSFTKKAEFYANAGAGLALVKGKSIFNWTKNLIGSWTGFFQSTENWPNIDAIHRMFMRKRSAISDYVHDHWKEDAFFGYQFLNGNNPMLIQRCSVLPNNFPVSDDKVFPDGQCSLEDEMKKGNIFLCDYKRLDGLKANCINGKEQYLTAPLVLLHKTPDDQLMPIAIQLQQTPADDNPIFFPTDSEYDWLLAKIFVRSADFNEHELNVHLLRTHLLAEVFAVSLLRNVPMVHPLYKLLVPHTRYTLHINGLARTLLISGSGVFTKFAASGKDLKEFLKKSLPSVTYSSLCIPDDIADRGLEDVPNFYYRDDGLKLWEIIHRCVQGVLSFYYKNDTEVQRDDELQNWISDIFEHGFLSEAGTGIPESFTTVDELVKFVTMVIFTCSGQHSAVNAGQYDYGGWMPNTPLTLQHPPPITKGETNEATLMKTLPTVKTTFRGMNVVWLLSKQSRDSVYLGNYPQEQFSENLPCKLIKEFQRELKELSAVIADRNKDLEVPYTYLDPSLIENSVAL